MAALRREQRKLQRVYGGRLHEPVHLTVQRFRLEERRARHELARDLMAELGALAGFPVVAARLEQMEHPFWESCLIRWRVRATARLRGFCAAVEGLLVERGIVPHFPLERGWEPQYVTALEETEARKLDRHGLERPFPCHLFDARRVVLSRVETQRTFRTLGESRLAGW